MRVRAIDVRRFERPRPHAVLRVGDEDGHRGLGEAAPLPGFSRETFDETWAALGAFVAHLRDREVLLEAVDDLRELLPDALLAATPVARAAAETALLDLLAQRRDTSMAELLGGGAREDDVLLVNALVENEPVATLLERARSAVTDGYTTLKIKLRATSDAAFADELAALRGLRAFAATRSPSLTIRLDPNGIWSPDLARRRLAALAEVAPAYVEEPCAPEGLLAIGPTPVPWAADEAIADADLVERLLDCATCSVFVLKPAFLGGPVRTRELAMRARSRDKGIVVTHFRDGPIGLHAARELAFSLPEPRLAQGLAPHGELAAFAREQALGSAGVAIAEPSSGVVRRARRSRRARRARPC